MSGPASALEAAQADTFSVAEAIGGWRGAAESTLPLAVFLLADILSCPLALSIGLAAGVLVVAAVIRLVQRVDLTPLSAGAIGLAIGAVWALWSGKATNFFAFGLILDALYVALLGLSVLVGRNAVGWVLAATCGLESDWPSRYRAFAARTRWVSLVWLAVFAARLLVQGPLYLAGAPAALASAKLAMGLPLFAVAAYLTWRLLAGHMPSRPGVSKTPQHEGKCADGSPDEGAQRRPDPLR